mmetsp:Transcript_95919/g.271165  ORF Transcript_95919/g.271165 Transcript_95919/m.271165 type:complete len:154 (-) Transcript_95919:37-498(-)
MASASIAVLLVAGLAAQAAAYVQPAQMNSQPVRSAGMSMASPALTPALQAYEEAAAAEADASQGAATVLAASCGVGAVLGWLGAKRRQAASAAAMASTAAAGLAPLSARAAGSEMESSITIAGGEEALFYVFILLATLITLVLSVVLREAPRV